MLLVSLYARTEMNNSIVNAHWARAIRRRPRRWGRKKTLPGRIERIGDSIISSIIINIIIIIIYIIYNVYEEASMKISLWTRHTTAKMVVMKGLHQKVHQFSVSLSLPFTIYFAIYNLLYAYRQCLSADMKYCI